MFQGSVRAFDEVARVKSIRKASDILGLAPSSVSRQVAILEHQIGTSLLERQSHGVELTRAGALVADYVRRILLEYDGLRADLDDVRGNSRHLVRLAAVESIASSVPMEAVRILSQSYPGVSFNFRLLPAPLVIEAITSGQAEIGLAYCARPDPQIARLASIPEPVMLAVAADHALAASEQLRIQDLASIRLGLPDRDLGVRRIIDEAAASAGVRLDPVLSSNDFEVLRAFVRRGSGAALLPMRAILHDGGKLRAVPVDAGPFAAATIDLIVLRERRLPRILKAFVNALIVEIAQAGRS